MTIGRGQPWIWWYGDMVTVGVTLRSCSQTWLEMYMWIVPGSKQQGASFVFSLYVLTIPDSYLEPSLCTMCNHSWGTVVQPYQGQIATELNPSLLVMAGATRPTRTRNGNFVIRFLGVWVCILNWVASLPFYFPESHQEAEATRVLQCWDILR